MAELDPQVRELLEAACFVSLATLMSDGATVYELGSSDEVIDLLRRGQGVFGIAVGPIVREVEGTLAELPCAAAAQPAEPAEGAEGDELASRRRRRTSA